MWAHVVIAYLFTFILMYLLWKNYREVVTLRKLYFESPEYVDSLHARTLMIWDIPGSSRSDAGLSTIVNSLSVPADGTEKCSIGRNVKELPELIEMHGRAVRRLEKVLAKYLKNPDRLPATKPLCKPDKEDKAMNQNMKVDAIEYYKQRIEELEKQIVIVRKGIDDRDAMPYGFVSFPTISRAHITAKAARHKHPKGTSMQLATKPQDIIWQNLNRAKAKRKWNSLIGHVLFVLLSVLYVIPNILIAVFLSNLNNISLVWPAFTPHLAANYRIYTFVQGFLAPTITSIIYLLLPVLMRRLSAWQGDITKSSREKHVTHKLYVFFILNNLIMFTLFGTFWSSVRDLITIVDANGFSWTTVTEVHLGDRIAVAIFDVSSFWITYLLQRNLGAILDLAQLVSLIGKSFSIHFLSPTPREKIEWTAPPPFDYASYYNYFLFYVTIALCFATVQPLVLPVAFFYFLLDSFLKKYTLMYVFVTKVESGGTFWRMIFNRLLFATGLFICVVALIVWSRYNGRTACTLFPLLVILILFKIYCHRTFDPEIHYHIRGSDRDSMLSANNFNRKDRLDKRYSHPALHRNLLRPMVNGKAEHMMAQIFGNGPGRDGQGGIGMDSMQHGKAGKKVPIAGFEVVQEEDMDFANFKNRAEFGDDHGGGGILYGDEHSMMGTMTPPPGFGSPASSRPGSPVIGHQVAMASPLGTGGNAFSGGGYFPVVGQAPPRSPHFAPASLHRPESPYDYTYTDHRSETGSVTHLLNDQHHPAPYRSHYYEEYRGDR